MARGLPSAGHYVRCESAYFAKEGRMALTGATGSSAGASPAASSAGASVASPPAVIGFSAMM